MKEVFVLSYLCLCLGIIWQQSLYHALLLYLYWRSVALSRIPVVLFSYTNMYAILPFLTFSCSTRSLHTWSTNSSPWLTYNHTQNNPAGIIVCDDVMQLYTKINMLLSLAIQLCKAVNVGMSSCKLSSLLFFAVLPYPTSLPFINPRRITKGYSNWSVQGFIQIFSGWGGRGCKQSDNM